ncbi:MAG: hypothetical protein ACREKG_06965 [Candidatus Rokuibacteriota bacterium]
MRTFVRLVAIGLAGLLLAPAGAWADDRGSGRHDHGSGRHDHGSGQMSRPHHHRPHRPIIRRHSVIPCCLGIGAFPIAPPPVIVTTPPPVYVIVPSPPSLVYVPTPRPDPAPEITLPTGRWARHGNGIEYPYVWVWVGPAPGH